MQPLAIILFKSVVTAAILLAYYTLVLRNRKLHTFNRFYLLATVVVSMTVPFLHFDWYTIKEVSSATTTAALQILSTGGEEEIVAQTTAATINPVNVSFITYVIVSAILLAILVFKIVWVYRIKRSHNVTSHNGFDLINTDLPKAPFSFLNNIFWKDGIDLNSEPGERVLQHELAHIKQLHTLDKLFLQLVLVVCWINPFYWYIQKELSMVHEFLADEHAVADNDTSTLAQMLLASHYTQNRTTIVNPFFYSSIKRRIVMLKQTNNTRYAQLRRAMVLPLLLVPVMLFSFTVHKNAPAEKANTDMTLILDAGHGGIDKGGETSFGLKEKDLTLSICKKMATLSSEYGITVVMTRNADEYPTLAQRLEMANKINEGVLISIHVNQNHHDSKLADGYEIIVSAKNQKYTESKNLASAIAGHLKSTTVPPIVRLSERNIFVLRDNQHPAIAIECGNIDNANDMAVLQDDKKLEDFCRKILAGVVAHGYVEDKLGNNK